MKRIISLIILIILSLTFASCDTTTEESNSADAGVKEVGSVTTIVKEILSANSLTKGKTFTSESTVLGEYLDADLISGYYGFNLETPDFTKIEEYCVYIEDFDTNLRIEIGIFKVKSSNDNAMVTNFLTARKNDILEKAVNYPSVDTEPFKNVVIETVGKYTYYIAVKENRSEINDTIQEKLGA